MGALYDAYEKSKTGQVGNDQRSLQQVMDDYAKQHNRSAIDGGPGQEAAVQTGAETERIGRTT